MQDVGVATDELASIATDRHVLVSTRKTDLIDTEVSLLTVHGHHIIAVQDVVNASSERTRGWYLDLDAGRGYLTALAVADGIRRAIDEYNKL